MSKMSSVFVVVAIAMALFATMFTVQIQTVHAEDPIPTAGSCIGRTITVTMEISTFQGVGGIELLDVCNVVGIVKGGTLSTIKFGGHNPGFGVTFESSRYTGTYTTAMTMLAYPGDVFTISVKTANENMYGTWYNRTSGIIQNPVGSFRTYMPIVIR